MKNILIKNSNIYLGDKEGSLLKDTDILIVGNLIKEIGKDIKPNGKTKIIDAKGKYITPGLINLHAHLPGSGTNLKLNNNTKKLVKFIVGCKPLHFIGRLLSKSAAKKELLSGVTTVRAVGGVEYFDSQVKEYIEKHPKKGSRLFVADYAITVKDGHMSGTVSKEINNLDEGLKMIEDLKSHNVDLIKLMITGGVLDATKKGSPGELKMPFEMVKPLVDKAHKLGLKVASHTESTQGVKVALKAGVDFIEHGCKVDKETIDLYKKTNSACVATISPAIPCGIIALPGMTDVVAYNAKYLLKEMISGARNLINEGITVGLGNDVGCPYVTHNGFYREVELFHTYVGQTREYALYTATQVNAELLGQGDRLGSIKESKVADLVILNDDPMRSFTTFANPYMVIKQGYLIKNTKQKKNKEIETKMDSILNLDIDKELKDIGEEKIVKKHTISKADQDMINELDYENKRTHKPYDRFERHWDEA